jgi:hypothetical protein
MRVREARRGGFVGSHIFFYGSFMDPEAPKKRGFQPAQMKRAFDERYSLQLGERGAVGPNPDGRVHAIIIRNAH